MPWGDSGIYGGYCTGLKPPIFAQNWGERGRFVKMMIIRSHRLSLYDFLWSSLCIYRKMMIIRSHEIGNLVTSYDDLRMIIRSHRNWMVASYDHHFHKSPPFSVILSKNSGFEACTACPIYARITPGHQLKRSLLAISYESRITLLIRSELSPFY